jgi:AmiR/NasT family two-component response regulator
MLSSRRSSVDSPISRQSRDGLATVGLDRAAAPADTHAETLNDLVVALAEENAQLRHALASRVVIEQAKGVLSERFGIDVAEAFDVLRRSARNHRVRLHELAERVVASRVTPPEIAVTPLAGGRRSRT